MLVTEVKMPEEQLGASSSSRAGELGPDEVATGAKVTEEGDEKEVLEVVIGEEIYLVGQQSAEHVADLAEMGVELKWTAKGGFAKKQ